MRSSSCGSLATDLPPGEKRRPRPANSAWPAYCMCRRRNRSRSGKLCTRGDTAPPSRREMSSMALKDRSRLSTERIRLRPSGSSGEFISRLCKVAANRPSACTGWRRSWLAMARKRLLSLSLRCAASRSDSRVCSLSLCSMARSVWWRQRRCSRQPRPTASAVAQSMGPGSPGPAIQAPIDQASSGAAAAAVAAGTEAASAATATTAKVPTTTAQPAADVDPAAGQAATRLAAAASATRAGADTPR